MSTPIPNLTLKDAIEGYLIHAQAAGLSPHTIAIYRRRLHQMAKYLGANTHLAAITSGDLERFMAYMRTEYRPRRASGNDAPLAPATLDNIWCAIRSFFRWANETMQLPRPDLHLQRPQFQPPEIIPFTDEEIRALLRACQYTATAKTNRRSAFAMRRPTARRDRALILLMLDTGLRVSEIARTNIADLNLEAGEITIQPYGSGRKTKPRTVPLGARTLRALWEYLAWRKSQTPPPTPDSPLFAAPPYFTRLDRHAIRRLLQRLGERAGVHRVYPHRFRHTFAIRYLRNGGDIFTLQRILGHSSLDMVRRYLHIAQADLKTAHRKASPVDNLNL